MLTATLLVPKWPLFLLHDPRDHLCSRPDPPRRYLTFCDPLLPTPSNYHIAPTETAATCLFDQPASLRPHTAPSVSCSTAGLS
ncbi:hypothetical protein TNCV_3031261 [Trichonephila clavipes]|nr:hypothetical protein TNCV_3031261 [Trichonephila clavipes]